MEEAEKIDKPNIKFEVFNYWSNGLNGFHLFAVILEKNIFAYVDALQIILFNFEFRWYLKKK